MSSLYTKRLTIMFVIYKEADNNVIVIYKEANNNVRYIQRG